MSERNKRIFVVELIAIALSLLPLLFYFIIPAVTPEGQTIARTDPAAAPYEADRLLFIGQLCIFIGFPLISLLAGFFFAFFYFEWYLAMSAGPVSFLFSCYIVVGHANLLLLGITFPVVLLYTVAYTALGAIVAFPTARLRARAAASDPKKVINDGKWR